jgi:hypothetical protein
MNTLTKPAWTKTALSISCAALLGATTLVATPKPAHALAEWVIPVIIGTAIVGVGTGAVVNEATHRTYAYEGPRGNVYVQPTGCHWERARYQGRWHNVQVCP